MSLLTVTVSPADVPRLELDAPSVRIDGSGKNGAPYFEEVEDARWLSDGRIVVADAGASRIDLYDSTGVFIRSLGGKGDGPGEVAWLSSLSVIPGDTIAVYDRRQRTLKLFDPDAGFVRDVRVQSSQEMTVPAGAWPVAHGRTAVYTSHEDAWSQADGPFPRRWPVAARLGLLGDGGALLAGPLTFDGGYVVLVVSAGGPGDSREPFSPRPFVSVRGAGVLLGSGATFALTELDSMFTPRMRLRWPGFGAPIPPDEIAAVRAEWLPGKPTEAKRTYVDALLGEKILPPTRPALSHAFVDGRGRVWAGSFEPWVPHPPLNHETAWYVVDPARGSVSRLDLPAAWRGHLGDVRGDRALVVTLDSMDVASVGVYRVRPAPDGSGG